MYSNKNSYDNDDYSSDNYYNRHKKSEYDSGAIALFIIAVIFVIVLLSQILK